jgi:DNA-binding beta-propeller fold protein YncE
VDPSGNVYIGDAGHNEVRMVNTAGIITTVAGTGENGYSGDGGIATQALLNYPWGVKTDASGNVYVADRVNTRVRMLASGAALGVPLLRSDATVNGASFAQNTAIAPGAIVAIFGSNLATAHPD